MGYQSRHSGTKIDAAVDQLATLTETAAAASANAALATQKADAASVKANEAAASAAQAAAVVTGGTATLTPEGGKIPLARAGSTIDPRWLDQVPSRASFEKVANSRRMMFAGSGFVDVGAATLANYTAINAGGLFARTTANAADANSLTISGTIRNNVNGYVARMESGAKIAFPPAPADASLLDRQDLVFLEVWHEDISEKDFIYPFGNVQSLATTYVPPGGAAINTVVPAVANFTGFDTYSLFGNWQTANALVGRGMKWSTMTALQQQQFLSDPENNCYIDGGKIIQVRYRIRVVPGLGSNWDRTTALFAVTGTSRVVAKGNRVSITNDIEIGTPANAYINAESQFNWMREAGLQISSGVATTDSLNVPVAYSGLCFAMHIALVQRRNQGAYHPVWNPNGSARCLNVDDATAALWYNTDRAYTSAADCFTHKSSGLIGGTSGRPDGLFYDEINERDVLDLRNSAHKQTDLRRVLEREFNRLVAGTTRGWQKNTFTTWGATDDNVTEALSVWSGKTMLFCDLIGSYANLKAAFPNGVAGRWLRFAEDGTTSLIPDGTSKIFKASRKVKTALMRVFTDNAGATWGTATGGWVTDIQSVSNAHTYSPPATRVELWFYLTEASPLANATNAEVLALGAVAAANNNAANMGALLCSWLLGKVPVSTTGPLNLRGYDAVAFTLDATGKLATAAANAPTHAAVTALTGASGAPGHKKLAYLTRQNGKLYLQLLYKEMRHNGTSWGDNNAFSVVDNESTTTDNNALTVRIGQKRVELNLFAGDGE